MLQYNIYNIQHPIKITKHVKKRENETHNQKKNQLIGTEPKVTDMIELAEKGFKSNILNIFIKLKKNMNIMSRETEDIKKKTKRLTFEA